MSPQLLEIEHNRVLEATMALFHSTKKMGGAEFSQPFADRLHDELMGLYGNFQKHNESKNILAAARTPAVLFIVMVVCYVLAGFFSLVYATNLAQLCNLVMGLALIALALWAYVRYSGSYREVGVIVDGFADFVWVQVSVDG
jgi:atlastin